MSMQKFMQTLEASASLRMNIAGEYFRLGSTSYSVTVRFYKGSSVTDEMLLIDGGTWARVDGGFDGFELINSSSGAQTLDVFVGIGEIGIDRILGEVSVISGELVRVKSQTCFAVNETAIAVAGQYSMVQLWNPEASGKNLILNRMNVIGFTSAITISVRSTVVQLATAGFFGRNKYLGKPASSGQARTENAAAVVASDVLANIGVAAANDTAAFEFSEPILIPPGYGVLAYPTTVNVALSAAFQWLEESI